MSVPRSAPAAVIHFLNRAGYGPTLGLAKEVLEQGLEPYIKAQLAGVPDTRLDARLRGLPSLDYPISKVLAIHQGTLVIPGQDILKVLDDFYTAKLMRAVHSKNQLR